MEHVQNFSLTIILPSIFYFIFDISDTQNSVFLVGFKYRSSWVHWWSFLQFFFCKLKRSSDGQVLCTISVARFFYNIDSLTWLRFESWVRLRQYLLLCVLSAKLSKSYQYSYIEYWHGSIDPTIYNIIRWFAGSLGQMTCRQSVWCSKCYFFSQFLAKFFAKIVSIYFFIFFL